MAETNSASQSKLEDYVMIIQIFNIDFEISLEIKYFLGRLPETPEIRQTCTLLPTP